MCEKSSIAPGMSWDVVLGKQELDAAVKDKKHTILDESFTLTLHMEPVFDTPMGAFTAVYAQPTPKIHDTKLRDMIGKGAHLLSLYSFFICKLLYSFMAVNLRLLQQFSP